MANNISQWEEGQIQGIKSTLEHYGVVRVNIEHISSTPQFVKREKELIRIAARRIGKRVSIENVDNYFLRAEVKGDK